MSPRAPAKNNLEIAELRGGRHKSLVVSLTRKPAFWLSGADAQQWVHQAKSERAQRLRGQVPEIERQAADRRARDYIEARFEFGERMTRPAQSSFAARARQRARSPRLAHVSYSRKESSIGQLPNSYPRELKWRAVRPSIRNALKA